MVGEQESNRPLGVLDKYFKGGGGLWENEGRTASLTSYTAMALTDMSLSTSATSSALTISTLGEAMHSYAVIGLPPRSASRSAIVQNRTLGKMS
jgi:hypothetical protein